MNTTWNDVYYNILQALKSKSKDRSTKVAAIIVDDNNSIISTGFNGFPRGCSHDNDDKYHERPLKYSWTEHAERNAIYNAARRGIATAGCSMYCTWHPCTDCARSIVMAGITKLYCYDVSLDTSSKWADDFKIAGEILKSSNVPLISITSTFKGDSNE